MELPRSGFAYDHTGDKCRLMDTIEKENKWSYCSAAKAINELAPGAAFSIQENDLSTLDWQDSEISQPSDSAITAKIAEYETEWNNSGLAQSKRAIDYPRVEEQLDKLFHDIDQGKLDKTGTFYAALKAVKDANPKG